MAFSLIYVEFMLNVGEGVCIYHSACREVKGNLTLWKLVLSLFTTKGPGMELYLPPCFFETISHCPGAHMVGSGGSELRNLPVSTSPALGLHVCITSSGFFMWVLGTELSSSCSIT